MLPRQRELLRIRGLLKRYPVVGIVGARQVGDRTFPLARNIRAVSLERLLKDVKPLR